MKELKRSGAVLSAFWYGAGLLFLLVAWALAAYSIDSPILLPGPVAVFRKLLSLMFLPNFLFALQGSLFRVLVAIVLSVPVSVIIGILAGLDLRVASFIKPLFSVVSATPVLSIILIAFIWFGQDITPVFAAFLIMFPVMTANTMEGVCSADIQLKELFTVYTLTRWQMLKYLYIPSVLPYVIAGLRSSLALCWKVVVAAEVLVQPLNALGTGMQNAKAMLETTELFAWTAATVIIASLTEILLKLLNRFSTASTLLQRSAS